MAATEYEKYIIREPLSWNTFTPFTPRLLFDTKNYFPEMNFGIRYTYINEPIHMERPHAHDFDQFFCFMGTPEDMRVFDGEAELHLGEESTKIIINSTTVAFVPKGMVHCPIIWTRVSQPMMFINIVLASSYTRSDQRTGYYDRLEMSARKVSAAEAGRVLGTALPRPGYLPEGCKIQEIYALGNSIKMLISDKAIEKRLVTVGDATPDSRQQHAFDCRMGLNIKVYSKEKGEPAKAPGEPVKVGKYEGVLADREQHVELRWLLPSQGTRKQGMQYEMVLSAGKRTSKEELLKVAGSVA
ncbi:MAG: hypothetical protein A2Z29_03630 [Chloroflexi bacterium RBG_16_56_11]|nr:MAG: hypothetical protein A2Z29_03630 [Chloroflexi bacterium RBG_16_56_11]